MDSSHRRGHAKKEKMTHHATQSAPCALPSGPEHGVVRGARGPGGGPVRRRVLRVVCAPGTVPWGDVRAHGKVARRRPTGMAPSCIRDQRRTGHRRRGRGCVSGHRSDRNGWDSRRNQRDQRTRNPGGRPACRQGRSQYRHGRSAWRHGWPACGQGRSSYGQGRSSYTDRVARAARRQGCDGRIRRRCGNPRRSLGRVGRSRRGRCGRSRRGDRSARRARTAGGGRGQARCRWRRFRSARLRRRVRAS